MAEGKVDAGHRGFNLIIIKTDALAEPNADAEQNITPEPSDRCPSSVNPEDFLSSNPNPEH